MVTYKQWKTLNESFVSTFGSVLASPSSVGVIGGTGASDMSLEETKSRIRKYMFGDDEGDEESDGPPKGKGGRKKPNPFGPPQDHHDDDGDDDGDDDDGDDDDGDEEGEDGGAFGKKDDMSDDADDMGHGGGAFGKKMFGKKDDMGGGAFGKKSKGMFGKKDDMGDDDMGHDDMGDDDADDMGHDDMGDDDMGHDDMGHDDMGHDDMGGGGLGMGVSAKGHVCDHCAHHEPDKNAKFCKMCGKGMSKFMKKFMSKDGCSVKVKGKSATPWLNKGADHGEVKSGGKETGKDMFKTVKGGKKERGKNEHAICKTCGLLACEVHSDRSPRANRLDDAFFKSLTSQVGVHQVQKWDDGFREDFLISPPEGTEPGPGEVGYAPQGRVGGALGA